MPIQLGNIRLGHATNSSSTHSIIFLKKKVKDDMAGQGLGEFGWQHFTAASRDLKARYLATVLHDNIAALAGNDVAETVTQSWLGSDKGEGYVDHQSELVLPRAWDGRGIEKMYLEQLTDFLLQDGVVILGGNDNTSEGHSLLSEAEQVFQIPHDRGGMVARWDEAHQFWTLFDRHDGAKIRMRFLNPGEKETPITKAEAPELVDMKITDFCPFGCEFCYQDSTEKGKHASYDDIERYIWNLEHLRVFEVAIGGGEPTLHPKFLHILRSFRGAGIVPNFTTKRIDWMKDKNFADTVFETVGGVGISNPGWDDIAKISAHCTLNEWSKEKIVLHYVMGSGDEYDFKSFLLNASTHHLPVLLLGWKNVGRGAMAKKLHYRDWTKWWQDLRKKKDFYVQISIDTALAKESQKELDELKIPARLYETHEGKFSMYIDAVANTMAASSYGGKAHKIDLTPGVDVSSTIKKAFARF